MTTNLALNKDLLEEAQRIGNFKTKRETVNNALLEFINHRKQLKIIECFGTIDYYDDYDYKKNRIRNENPD